MRRADNLTTFMCQLSRHSGSLNLLEPSGPIQACIGIACFSSVQRLHGTPKFSGRLSDCFVLYQYNQMQHTL
jgi:hypothetical protein